MSWPICEDEFIEFMKNPFDHKISQYVSAKHVSMNWIVEQNIELNEANQAAEYDLASMVCHLGKDTISHLFATIYHWLVQIRRSMKQK